MTDIEAQPEYRDLLESSRALLDTMSVQLMDRPKRQAAFIGSMDKIYRHWDGLERRVSEAVLRAEDAEAETTRVRERFEATMGAHRLEIDAEGRRSALAIAEMQRDSEEAMGKMQAAHAQETMNLREEYGARLSASEAGRLRAEATSSSLHAALARTLAVVEGVVASMGEEHTTMSDAVDTLRRRLENEAGEPAPLQIEHVPAARGFPRVVSG